GKHRPGSMGLDWGGSAGDRSVHRRAGCAAGAKPGEVIVVSKAVDAQARDGLVDQPFFGPVGRGVAAIDWLTACVTASVQPPTGRNAMTQRLDYYKLSPDAAGKYSE